MSRTEHQEQGAAPQQHGDEQDPFFQQQQGLQEQNGELPPKAPEHGDPIDGPLQDGPAEEAPHRG